MPRITISYRREDSGVITGRIFDRLVAQYGRDAIFRDIDDVPIGVDFRDHISSVLDASDIVLAIVGPRWLGPRGSQNRLANEADPVRVEIDAALRKGLPLIPVLVLRGAMPKASQLPESLQDFAYRNAVQVDAGQDFDVHMLRLIRAMDRILAQQPAAAGQIEPAQVTSAAEMAAPAAEAFSPPAGNDPAPEERVPIEPSASMSAVAVPQPVAAFSQQPGPVPRQRRSGLLLGAGLAFGMAMGVVGALSLGLVGRTPPPQPNAEATPPASVAAATTAAQRRVDELEAEQAALRNKAEQERTRLNADLAEARRQRSSAEAATAALRKRLDEQTAQNDDLRARAEKAEQALAAEKEKLTAEKEKTVQNLAKIELLSGQVQQFRDRPAAAVPVAAESAPAAVAPPDDLREHRQALRALGHLRTEADGESGPGMQAAIKQFQSFEGAAETGTLSAVDRHALRDMAQRLAGLLERPAASPAGVAAANVKGGAQRYARAWGFERAAKPDPAEAVYWYGLAAADGEAKAFTNLGTLIARGWSDTPPDPASARLLWWAAAARGEAIGMFNIGAMYERGIGVSADPAKARAWYERAAAHNHAEAAAALKRLGS